MSSGASIAFAATTAISSESKERAARRRIGFARTPRTTTPFVATADVLRFCEPDARPMKVAVLLSGGVDSSVALTLLQAAGHDVTAFYLQIWFQEDFRNYWDQCPWEDDLSEARAVCDLLRVPLEVVPLTRPYWDLVVSHSVEEISRGRTPNPDMLCNSRVKFGAFREWLAETHPGRFARCVLYTGSHTTALAW